MRTILLLTSMAITLAAAGCGGDDTTEGGGCGDFSGDLMNPPTALLADVMPIFQTSCTIGSTCHGAMSGSSGFTYLGPPTGLMPSDMELAAVIAQNVGASSRANAGMPRITAGDPGMSFLMHKMDNTLTCSDLACGADGSCGTLMPQGATQPIAQESRDKVRRWIAQGAQNN